MKKTGETSEQTYKKMLRINRGDKQRTMMEIEDTLDRIKEEPNPWGKFMMSNFWNRVKSFATKDE